MFNLLDSHVSVRLYFDTWSQWQRYMLMCTMFTILVRLDSMLTFANCIKLYLAAVPLAPCPSMRLLGKSKAGRYAAKTPWVQNGAGVSDSRNYIRSDTV